jgi:hypothetical protein
LLLVFENFPGFHFFIAGLICFGACLILLLPGIPRTFFGAQMNLQTELPNQELVEEKMIEM